MPNEWTHDSDRTPLDAQPRVRLPRPWRRIFETVAVVGSLFLGGFGSGYFWTARQAEAQLARQREDHLAEIDRLNKVFGGLLTSIAGRVSQAAGTAASAALTAEEAASTAQSAAETAAHTASQTATQAARTAAKEMKKP